MCSDVFNLSATMNGSDRALLAYLSSVRLGGLVNTTHALIDELKYGFGKLDTIGLLYPLVGSSLPIPTGILNQSMQGLVAGDAVIAYTEEPMNISHPLTSEVIDRLHYLEVVFYWCTKTYKTTVKNGIPVTTELSSHAKLIDTSQAGLNFAWSPIFYDCYQAGTCNKTIGGWKSRIEGPPQLPAESYSIDSWTALLASALLEVAMYDSIFVDGHRGLVSEAGGGVAQALVSALLGEFLSTEVPTPDVQFAAVRNISNNMARSITNQ
jgi:hypothetical protein